MRVMIKLSMLWLFLGAALGAASAAETAAPAVNGGSPEEVAELREIVATQKLALAEARAATDAEAREDQRPRVQKVVDRYEALLKKHPDFAAGWAGYGLLLCDPLIDERRAALGLLLKANGLDPEIPVVKNQIGVIMAEQGRVIDAFNYFLAACDLAPNEPLYHFQIGLVLDEGRDIFLKTGAWKRADLDKSMLAAFARATELAPMRTDFAYRGAEAYYDLEVPQWEAAYRAWTRLEARLSGQIEKQAVRLHRARVLWKEGLAGDARDLLESVDEATLLAQKAKLAAEFAAEDAAEARAKAGSSPIH